MRPRRLAAPLLGYLGAVGCVASPVTTPGFVDMRTPEAGQVDTGVDARAIGMSSVGIGAGGTIRATPHVRERWSVPVEAGAFPTVQRGGISHGNARVGFRRRVRPWLSLGAGGSANGMYQDRRFGFGGGGDLEIALGRSWGRFGVSGTFRPGVSANAMALATLWLPGEVAFAWHATPRVSVWGALFGAGGLAVAGPFGMLVGAGGAGLGIQVRLGPAPTSVSGRRQ